MTLCSISVVLLGDGRWQQEQNRRVQMRSFLRSSLLLRDDGNNFVTEVKDNGSVFY